MSLKPDDFNVGMWVAIERDNAVETVADNPFWFPNRRESKVDGMPLRIVAISLPFVCVTNGNHRFVLDTREVQLCRLTPQFVKALTSTRRLLGNDGVSFSITDRSTKPPKVEQHERACPICQDRLIERYSAGVWNLVCRQCGFCGGHGAMS